MNVALVGCGYVADYYFANLAYYDALHVVGVMDTNGGRAANMGQMYGVAVYPTLAAVLADPRVDMVLNLTNPESHYEITRAALLAGKHVYSEKPLAMEMAQAVELVEMSEALGLQLSCAPCSVLGESAQTMHRVLREGSLGAARLVYAEMEDGMVHRKPYETWVSASGAPWPAENEFEMGCTLEHAAYCVHWLCAWFGPVVSVTTFAAVVFPEKIAGSTAGRDTADFSVACLTFGSGVVARITCGIVGPEDRSMTVVCEDGNLYLKNCWDIGSRVTSRRRFRLRNRLMLSPLAKRHRLPSPPVTMPRRKMGGLNMDFARGPAEMASAIEEGRAPRLSARFSLHVHEIVLAMDQARTQGATRRLESTFAPVEPMDWSR